MKSSSLWPKLVQTCQTLEDLGRTHLPAFMTLAGKHTISLRHVMTLAAGFLHEPPPCAVQLSGELGRRRM